MPDIEINQLDEADIAALRDLLAQRPPSAPPPARARVDLPPQRGPVMPVYNDDAADGPQGGLGRMTGEKTDDGRYMVVAADADVDAEKPLVVLCQETPAGAPGTAWADLAPHPLAVDGYDGVAAGDRVGPQSGGSWQAVLTDDGPYLVASTPGDTPTVDAMWSPLGGGGDPMLIEVTAIDAEAGTVTAYALDSTGNTTGDPMTLLDMTAFEDD